jgi:hypothetical protein
MMQYCSIFLAAVNSLPNGKQEKRLVVGLIKDLVLEDKIVVN